MTLRNDDELHQALEALTNLRLAVAALHRDVGTVNPHNFAVIAEGTLDEIARIESDVNEYLGLEELRAQLWMRIVGHGIHAGDAPTAVMTSLLDTFRKGLQAATEHAVTGKLSARPPARIQQAVDIRLAAIADGSLRIGLNIESRSQLDAVDDTRLEKASARSLEEYLSVAAWAGDEAADVNAAHRALEELLPDPQRRSLLLTLVMQLAPRVRGAVDVVEFSGRVVKSSRPVRLTRSSRARLAAAVDRVDRSTGEEHTGALRELDLDKQTGVVRVDGAEVPCEFVEELMPAAHEALGRRVRVVGSRTELTGRKRSTLFVTRLEIVDDAETAHRDGDTE